jgi:translation initiation factor 2B subunit (eIF-2B alpha/beta/delta family)
MMKDHIESILREIKEDRTTGAVELVKKGVDAIALFILNFTGDSSFFLEELIRISKILIRSQPTMAPFFHLANILLLSAESHRDLEEMKRATRDAIKTFVAHLVSSIERISKIATGLIPEGSRILTHSYSSTVLRTLVDAKKAGKRFEVICTESRPICEGLQLAKKLSEAQIRVQVQIDSATAYSTKETDLVLVGADCLTPLGLVNKVGTYTIALAAKEKETPFYALCGTEKLLGAGMAKGFRISKRAPEEVWSDPPEGVEVLNFYFDTTPLDFLSAIVTEEGIMSRGVILRRFQQMKVSEHFPI